MVIKTEAWSLLILKMIIVNIDKTRVHVLSELDLTKSKCYFVV